MSRFIDKEVKVEVPRRKLFKNNKYLIYSIMGQYLKERGDFKVTEDQLFEQVCETLRAKGINKGICGKDEFKQLFSTFDKCFCLEFNPSSSVVGALVS